MSRLLGNVELQSTEEKEVADNRHTGWIAAKSSLNLTAKLDSACARVIRAQFLRIYLSKYFFASTKNDII